jgi:hypothetical protein
MSAVLEIALMECTAQVIGSIHNRHADPKEVARFVELFRRDFTDALKLGSSEAEVWLRDRGQVTTLARAIASFAEFLAITDPAKPDAVGFEHLFKAYRVLGPYCNDDGNASIRRQYCTNVLSQLGRADNPRP